MRYLAAVLLLASLALAGWGYIERAGRHAAEAEAASLARSVATLENAREQARLAATVARAEAERQAREAAKWNAIREALLEGNEDAPLPPEFHRWGCSAGLWLCGTED